MQGACDRGTDQSLPGSSSTAGSNIDTGLVRIFGLFKPQSASKKDRNLAKVRQDSPSGRREELILDH